MFARRQLLRASSNAFVLLLTSHLLVACGGGYASDPTVTGTAKGGNSGKPTTSATSSTYSIGGTLSGLASGKSLVLTNNGSNPLTLSANGAFTFSTSFTDGSTYAVAVSTQPVGQTCTVANPNGTLNSANITNVNVTCTSSATTPTAKLLFKSNFGKGVSLAPVSGYYTSGHGAWQGLVGTDAETGFTWPIKAFGAWFSGVQLITIDTITADTINNYVQNTIQPVMGPKGTVVNELFQNVKIKGPVGAAGSQAPFIITRPTNIGDVSSAYISYWFKYPADLADKLDPLVSSGNWRVQFEFKTGGYAGNDSAGDYRIATNILKGTDGKMYWLTKGDNVANGPFTATTYWRVANTTVPIPVGKWFKFEVYWNRSAGSDGRYWSAVDGQVIVDRMGPNMGDYKLPINRIMINNAYSGGYPTVESHSTGLEIWDGFPCGVGKSCYVPPM